MSKKSVKSDSNASQSQVEQLTKKRTKKEKTPVEPVVEPVAEVSSVVETESVSENKEVKSRQAPNRESVEKEFNDLIAQVESEVEKLRSSSSKSKGVKFLRSINKSLKSLRNHSLRLSKQKNPTRRVNNNSGLNKPVGVSKELAQFLGSESLTHSRKDVTKFFCEYVKQNNLQLPSDRRIIMVDKDPKLKALLKYNSKDSKPLTLFSLQSYLKNHYVQSTPPTVVSSTVSPPPAAVSTKSKKSAK